MQEEIASHADVVPDLETGLEDWVKVYKTILHNPNEFGKRDEEAYGRVSSNPEIGTMITRLLPKLIENEKKISGRVTNMVLQTAKGKIPGVKDSQQFALGKALGGLESVEMSIAAAKRKGHIDGSTKGWIQSKDKGPYEPHSIPNDELEDFLKEGGHLYDPSQLK